jgi:VIT1/CCC1 family predicted Fe2+/Mn2+ transporter
MTNLSKAPNTFQIQLDQLNSQVEQLQEQLKIQTYELRELRKRIPNTNIINPKFLNRAFAVFGHYFVAGLIIVLPIVCLTSLFALVMILLSPQ